MAGMGPPPNPNARRQNNRDAGFIRIAGRRKGRIPPLPGGFSEATEAAWRAWWRSPQATEWRPEDMPTLVLMATAYDRALDGERTAWNEFRQWADRFGLSPLARLRLRWIVEDEAKADADAADSTVVRLRSAG